MADVTGGVWFIDFVKRIRQLNRLARSHLSLTAKDADGVWLGGLFYPESFITATRHAVAQSAGSSLESLQLTLDFAGDGADLAGNQFRVTGESPSPHTVVCWSRHGNGDVL